ncbi:MAG: hypothetical protein A2W23_05955 [Planctomycetes bacterium RBG_16_43_13]|nr:MAG: hypothetical protein A2W23_05955 [Planctomycetes bacterium RBG_16_43_13]
MYYYSDTYFYTKSGNHYISSVPIILPLVITPLYLPIILTFNLWDAPVERIILFSAIMEKIMASLIAAISVWAIFCLLMLITERKGLSILLSLVYAFATGTFAVSSQALWQHGFSELMIILTLIYLVKLEKAGNHNNKYLLLAGLFTALAVAERQTNVTFAIPVLVYIFLCYKRETMRFLIFPLIIGAGFVAYNIAFFGSLAGIYSQGGRGWDMPSLTSIAGVLISPSRGLFIYTPVFLFSIAGMFFILKRRPSDNATDNFYKLRKIYIILIAFVLLQILMISSWYSWWGGGSYGPRMLTDISPAMVLLMIPALDGIRPSAIKRSALVLSISVSIFIQIIGAFFYPKGNIGVDENPSLLWRWQDSQITRVLKAGPVTWHYNKILKRIK